MGGKKSRMDNTGSEKAEVLSEGAVGAGQLRQCRVSSKLSPLDVYFKFFLASQDSIFNVQCF